MNYCNYKAYTSSNSVRDYRDFKDNNYMGFGHPGWSECAVYSSLAAALLDGIFSHY